MRTFELRLLGKCEPFTPTHWMRAVSYDEHHQFSLDVQMDVEPTLVVDWQVNVPWSEPVGLMRSVNTKNHVAYVIDPNSFIPQIHAQTVCIHFRGENHYASFGCSLSLESMQDLRSVHNVDPENELIKLMEEEVDDILNGGV